MIITKRKKKKADHSSDVQALSGRGVLSGSFCILGKAERWAARKQTAGHPGESKSKRSREPKVLCLQEKGGLLLRLPLKNLRFRRVLDQ